MAVFDPNSIQSDAIRERYERALKRGRAMAGAMHAAFGPERAPVRMCFVDEEVFNAYAGRDDDGYLIELAKPIPLFLALLFERLLADPRLFPWLDAEGAKVSDYQVPFVFDPINFSRREVWSISLTEERSFAADFLADLSVAFIQLHELGHIMSGHVERHQLVTGRGHMAELLSSPPPSRSERERERAWEADADAVAASFLAQYVGELIDQTKVHPVAARVFGRQEQTVEHVLAIAAIALFAMFAYVRGARYSLGKRSGHPHPFIRAHYVKDMLITAAQRQFPIDLEVLGALMDERLNEVLIALEGVGLSDNRKYDDAYMDGIDRELEHIIAIRAKHRASCAAFSWFPWTQDANELGEPLSS